MHKPFTLRKETWRDKVRGRFSGDRQDFPTPEKLAGQREMIKARSESLVHNLSSVLKNCKATTERIDGAFENICSIILASNTRPGRMAAWSCCDRTWKNRWAANPAVLNCTNQTGQRSEAMPKPRNTE